MTSIFSFYFYMVYPEKSRYESTYENNDYELSEKFEDFLVSLGFKRKNDNFLMEIEDRSIKLRIKNVEHGFYIVLRMDKYKENIRILISDPLENPPKSIEKLKEGVIIAPILYLQGEYLFPRYAFPAIEKFYRSFSVQQKSISIHYKRVHKLNGFYILPLVIEISQNTDIRMFGEIYGLLIGILYALLRIKKEIISTIRNKLFRPWAMLRREVRDRALLDTVIEGIISSLPITTEKLAQECNLRILQKDYEKMLKRTIEKEIPLKKVNDYITYHYFFLTIFVSLLGIALAIIAQPLLSKG